jgi:hypothetical protein
VVRCALAHGKDVWVSEPLVELVLDAIATFSTSSAAVDSAKCSVSPVDWPKRVHRPERYTHPSFRSTRHCVVAGPSAPDGRPQPDGPW